MTNTQKGTNKIDREWNGKNSYKIDLSEKAVFQQLLKMSMEEMSLIFSRILFHKLGSK